MNDLELSLIRDVLETQTGEGVDGVIAYERIREVLSKGLKFTKEEKQLLWLQPDVRETFFATLEDLANDARWALEESGFTARVRLLAASGGDDVTTIPGNGYTLTVFKDTLPSGTRWSVSVQLEQSLRDVLFPSTVVRIVDGGGMVWLSGIPDDAGQISAIWPSADAGPLERLSRHGIRIGV